MLALVRLVALLTCAVVLSALPAAAHAATPANDAFSNAAPLTIGASVFGTNLGATSEGAEPSPTSNVVRPDCTDITDRLNCASSVWYSFEAPASTNYTIEDCDSGTDLTGLVSVWTGSGLGSLSFADGETSTICSAAGGLGVKFDAQAGHTYWVDVEGDAAAQGVFYLRAYPTSSPPAAAGPDTLIERDDSLAWGRLELNNGSSYGNDIQSGPRQTASFAFTSDSPDASFECSLDGAAFAACASPVSYDGLDSGQHTFKVRAVVGAVSDSTPAVQIFNIDDTSPDTDIAGPMGSLKITSAPWVLTSTDPDYEFAYKCQLDSSVPFICDGPQQTFGPLCAGNHQLQAAAFDLANNVDATPAVAAIDTNGSAGDDCSAPDALNTPVVSPTATSADIEASFDDMGSGGTLRLDWGTTTAYGSSLSSAVRPGDTSLDTSLFFLKPGTEYHYRLTLTNSLGSSTTPSPDNTFTTDSASNLPDISEGVPEVVGAHAVAIPINIDPHGNPISENYGVYIDDAPVTLASPFLEGADTTSQSTPFQRTLDVVDLAPSTTYHVRAWVDNGAFRDVETSERTFTTPAVSPPAPPQPPPAPLPPASGPPPPPHFVTRLRLRTSEVHLGRLRRNSKTLTLTVRGLPPGALVSVQLRANVPAARLKTLAKTHAKANAKGVAKLRLKLSRKARKVLHNRHVKSVTIRVAASVGHSKASALTLHKRLR